MLRGEGDRECEEAASSTISWYLQKGDVGATQAAGGTARLGGPDPGRIRASEAGILSS